jgi:DNA-binding PadR family transcriptional regulator
MSKIVMIVGEKEFYGYEIHKILESQGIEIEIGRLYRILNEMLSNDWFTSKWVKSQSGPRKRMYKLGEHGKKKREEILLDAIGIVHKFYAEYLRSLPNESSAFTKIVNFITNERVDYSNIGFVYQSKSKMVDIIVKEVHKKVVNFKIYLIKPNWLKTELKMENLLYVEGTYDSIPFRNSYFDLVIVVGVPMKELLQQSINEWSRVVNRGGSLVVVSPTVLIDDYRDPKTIGQFFEEYEHSESFRNEKIGTKVFKFKLRMKFGKVIEKKIVHITLLKASEPLIV